MTTADSYKELLTAVERGESMACAIWAEECRIGHHRVSDALHGSLDAGFRVMRELLPGWSIMVMQYGKTCRAEICPPKGDDTGMMPQTATGKNCGAALLIAALRALGHSQGSDES